MEAITAQAQYLIFKRNKTTLLLLAKLFCKSHLNQKDIISNERCRIRDSAYPCGRPARLPDSPLGRQLVTQSRSLPQRAHGPRLLLLDRHDCLHGGRDIRDRRHVQNPPHLASGSRACIHDPLLTALFEATAMVALPR